MIKHRITTLLCIIAMYVNMLHGLVCYSAIHYQWYPITLTQHTSNIHVLQRINVHINELLCN